MGNYGIGKISHHWTDITRQEHNNEYPNISRECMVHVYYPTNDKKNTPVTSYDKQALLRTKKFINSLSGIPQYLFKGWNSLKTYTLENTPITTDKANFPVIIFSHGMGTMVQHYTWILEELASYGYVVIGINHPYIAAITQFPDERIIESAMTQKKKLGKESFNIWKNEQINTCVEDTEFVIKKLEELNGKNNEFFQGKLDFSRLGIIGHSFGGDIALVLASKNNNIKAIINMDGGERSIKHAMIAEPYSTPTLMLLAEESHNWQGEQGIKSRNNFNQFCNEHKNYISQVIIKNAGHGVFSDLPILLNSTLFSRLISLFYDFDTGTTATSGVAIIDTISHHIVHFFDLHFNQQK
jgi:predicted dienelactone hydrolase